MRAVLTLLGVLLRDAVRHPLQASVSVLGVACGLAVVIAVHAAGRASRDSFSRTFEAVAGRATHQVTAPAGVAPATLLRLLSDPDVEAAQPIIEGLLPVIGWSGREAIDVPRDDADLRARLDAEAPLRLLGIDPLRAGDFLPLPAAAAPGSDDPLAHREAFEAFLTQPDTILVPRAWAEARSLRDGDFVTVATSATRRDLRIVGLLPPTAFPEATDVLAVADVATADEILGRGGRLDRVDVIVREGADAARLAAPGETIERPSQRGERAASLTDAFRLNLLALSTLALLVGSYLVFNSAQFAVVRREALLGQLRCLGASARTLLAAVVVEVALLGAIGSVAGLLGGSLLARALVGDVARTVSTLYGFVRPETASLSAGEILAFLALGPAVAVAAGWFPARDAAATPPRLVGSRSLQEASFARKLPQFLVLAAAGLAVTVASLAWPTRAKEAGFVAAFGILVTAGALLPPLLALLLPRLRRLAERRGRLTLALASGDVERSLSRTGIATSALAVSLAMAVGVMVMVSSFEREVSAWVESALVADLYVAPFRQEKSGDDARIPAQAVQAAAGLPGVRRLDALWGRDALLRGRLIRVLGMRSPGGEALAGRTFLHGEKAEAWPRLLAGEALISEPLSQHLGLGAGDLIELPSASGTLRTRVAGVVRDYALDRGYVLLEERTYDAAFGAGDVSNFALTLQPGTDVGEAATDLRAAFRSAPGGPYLMEVVASAALRDEVGVAFRQTFAVTSVLQGLSTALALAGIATALASLFLERRREVATLRAVGATLPQVAGIFLAQGGLLAALAGLAALPVGAALSWLLVDVVNVRSFGWGIRLHWPVAEVGRLMALALAAGLVASLVPWLLARRTDIAGALRE